MVCELLKAMVQGQVFRQFVPLKESKAGISQATQTGRRMYPGVTIIKAGLGNQRDRNYYPVETLEAAVKSGSFRGLRAFADHPDSISETAQPERTVRDMVGVYKNPRFVREGRNGGRVVADLHVFRSAKWLSETVDDLLELGLSDKIGLSINGRGKTVERQVTLEEAADPINVNWVEEFLALRSVDIVTEAGAGGGFTPNELLESARGSAQVKETAMKRLTEQSKTALREAVDTGDAAKVAKILRECGCETAAPTKAAKPAGKAPITEADDPAENEDGDALDAAADEIVNEAEADDAAEGDPVAEGDDADADAAEGAGDDDAADVEDEDDLEEASAASALRSVASKGAGKLISGKGNGQGKHGNTIKGAAGRGKVGSMTKNSNQRGQPGRKFGESSVEDENQRLREENARLSTQLRVRTTTDRGRNLLRESAIPEKLQPQILRLLVGKDERQMRQIIDYHEAMINTAIEESVGTGVEGAGSRLRESYGSTGNTDIGEVITDVGLPTK